ncbi:50S ribosomal protein L23 [Gammaproteobacteria bacterium]|nr:50S ribosomal protein L23 [Gammaproteobacteria bacterium]
MNQERILKTLLAPIVSEKTSMLAQDNKYAFKVTKDSTKREIKKAVETLFSVTVENVSTAIVKGKSKTFKGKRGQRSDWKKAVVKVSEGQMIDVSAQ